MEFGANLQWQQKVQANAFLHIASLKIWKSLFLPFQNKSGSDPFLKILITLSPFISVRKL